MKSTTRSNARMRRGALAASLSWLLASMGMAGDGASFPDFYLPGDLTVTIRPAEGRWQVSIAKDSAGDWVVNEGSWRPSGYRETGLIPGRYAVVVDPPPGHATPEPLLVQVPGGALVSQEVSLREVSRYQTAADIPPQDVRLGDTLEFQVLGPAALEGFEPHPEVERRIRFQDGAFTYRPQEAEREQFQTTFSGPGGPHTVLVTPQPRLAAETSALEYRGDFLPLEASAERKAYLTVLVEERTRTAEEGPLNLRTDRKARSATVSAPRVVFAPGHPNGLWEALSHDPAGHPVDDLESLAVYADQVVVRGRLHLPETDLTIHARELSFEDGAETAQIVTTPLKAPGKAANGVRGHDAGEVTLHVAAVRALGSAVRLDLRGGAGQDPVEGAAGAPLSPPAQTYGTFQDTFTVDCGFPIGQKSASELPDNCVYYYVDECCVGCRKKWERGTTAAIRSGKNASANGVPGNGGAGGVLDAPFDLAAITDVARGPAGPSQPARSGSAGDRPYNAVKVYNYYNCVCDWNGWTITRQNNVAGSNQPATSAPGPEPLDGAVRIEVPPFAWLHPVAVRSLLSFARDAYLNGYPDETRALLEPYAAALKAHADRPPETALELAQLQDEIEAVLQQIDSHLDFFGFPAGWVPMLSFEVTMDLFQDEVQAAGDILYLSHYLGLEAQKAVNKAGALERMRRELAREIQERQGRLDAAKARMGTLAIQARALDGEISALRIALRTRESELEGQAGFNAGLKKSFRVLGNVLPLIPVGQPALGLAGAGFTAASKFNEQSALDSGIEATHLAHVFLEGQLDEQLETFQSALCTVPPECAARAAFLTQQQALEGLDAAVVAVNQTLREAQTWESDVDREIQILAAHDPRHLDLVKRVRALNQRKKRFAEDLVSAVNEALKLSSGINHGFLALDSLNRDSVKTSARIDQEAIAYLREMGQRAKERLLRFQYYLVKAYHYRTLRPYHELPGGDRVFQLEEVFQHFEDEFFTDDFSRPNILDPDRNPSLVDLYADQVREITASIVDHLVAEPPEQTQVLNVELTAEELAALNAWDDSFGENPEGDLRINLVSRGGLFDQRQENLRIFSLRVSTLDVSPAPGTRASNVTVFVRHSGESLVSSRGNVYQFNHYRTLKQAPIAWRGIYDNVLGTHSSPELSAASNSLLEALLGGIQGQQIPRDLLLYSRPSAWADLVISKETLGGEEMRINRLVLQLRVDFSEKEAQAELEVVSAGEGGEPLAPNVLVSLADRNGRADGRGSFRRFYQPGESLTLNAQDVYGGYRFDRWVDARGNTLPGGRAAEAALPLGLSATVSRYRALYRYRPEVAPGGRFERGDVNADGLVDISDAIHLLGGLFTGGPLPACEKAADGNDDGATDISDAITLLGFLFTGGGPPPPPHAACGTDPTPDGLTCGSHPPCE